MTTTAQTSTQADLDAQTHQAFVDNGQNKAATARALGVSASAVADRIKRHLARHEQDTLADSRALDAAQAEQDAEYAADSEAAEQASPYVADPDNPTDEEISAAIDRGLADGSIIDAEDWMAEHADDAPAEPEASTSISDVIEQATAQATEVALAALARGEDTYVGPTCPKGQGGCDRVAYAFQGGHEPGCKYGKTLRPRLAGPVAVTVDDTVVAMVEHHDITGQDDEAESVVPPAAVVAPEPAKAEKTLVTECVRCSFHFSRPQVRQTCQSDKACQRRQAAKAGA